jgi:GAF domain-containing protein
MTGREEIARRYPNLERAASGERSMVALPLRAGGRALGSATLSFPGRRRFDAAEMEFLGILADTCAISIARVQALADADDRAAKLKFLADASAELASSLDYQATLKKVARLAVPQFADWCSIQLAEDGPLRTLAVAHVDPDKVALAAELNRRYPPDPDAPTGAYHVLKTGASELVPDITDEMLVVATKDEEHLRLARELNLRSGMSVPLKTRRRTIGVITWVTGEEGRRFGPEDLVFGEDLARRAAVAIDNAQLHTEIQEAAYRLQQAVLPEGPPVVASWDLVVDYTPAGRTEVGGDFYDVLPFDDGRLGLIVGDVMGRGVKAAAAMAQIRASARAYFAVDPDPAVLLSKLDGMFARFDLAQLVTMVYVLIDPAKDVLRMVNAGHPPPVVLRADGAADQLPVTGGTPLGVVRAPREVIDVPLHVADTLVMFTDGLIERRCEEIDVGQRRPLAARPGLGRGDLATCVRKLIDEVRDHGRQDDIAVLAARRRP